MNRCLPTRARRSDGFSLIELMIVVAIVAILAAIAIPSYQDSVWKGKRGEAKAAILRTLQSQERWYTQNNTYAAYATTLTSTGAPNGSFVSYSADNNVSNSRYLVSSVACGGGIAQCVRVVATVIGNADPKCGASMSADSQGNKLPSTAGCW